MDQPKIEMKWLKYMHTETQLQGQCNCTDTQ